MVTDTSLEAYHSLDLTTKEKEVVGILLKHPVSTSRMLQVFSGIERSSITGRLNSLENGGVVECIGKYPCKISGKRCKYYRVKL